MHQEIVLGESGQVFEVETATLPRAPVSVVVTNHEGEVQSAVTRCALDPVATVLAEEAPRGARMLHVGSTWGITPGARYDVGGQRIMVYRVDGAHRLVLRRPLLEPAKEDTALRGCRILAAIDDAWVRDPTKLGAREGAPDYQLAWTHAGGTEHTTADLVRVPLQARVTPADVDQRVSGWSAAVGDPVLAIAEAAAIVQRDLLRNPATRRVRDPAGLRELVILRARLVAVEEAVMFRGEAYARLAEVEANYHARLEALKASEPAAAVATGTPSPRFSVGHVRILDAVTAFFEARSLIDTSDMVEFSRTLQPYVRTADERQIVARYLLTLKNVTQGARQTRRALVAELDERQVSAVKVDISKVSLHHVKAIDWLMKWLDGRWFFAYQDLEALGEHWVPRLQTRDELQVAAKLLTAHQHKPMTPDAKAQFSLILATLEQRARKLDE